MNIMPSRKVREELSSRAAMVEAYLAAAPWEMESAPPRLLAAMRYSLNAGGKRLRPILCLACGALYGLKEEKILPFAAALEMVHTYSLIHDDLPAMDNDDLRRGRPSNHKKFDEATAILAGDALLTDAFYLASSADVPPQAVLKALRELAAGAGSAGMAGGQMLDMQYTGAPNVSLTEVSAMQALKTGALLRAACVCGALLAEAPIPLLNAVATYGEALGRAFQIADDILDLTGTQEELGKPVGNDKESGKNTYPSLVGIAQSREIARAEASKAIAALPDLPGGAFLAGLAEFVVERRK